ncbi:hypothetical protein L7F22_053813 [Adiantum nelumboides]|nr:hypothetical protein [Adiantum nelumboides]
MASASSSPTLRPFTHLPTLASCSSPLSLFRSPSLRQRPTCRHLRIPISSRTQHVRHVIAATTETGVTTSDADTRAGVAVYRPSSYDALISDAAKSLCYALDENRRRLEIEFPPLPSSISGYKGSSDEFLDANIQLVLALVRKIHQIRGVSSRVVFADKPEKRRATRVFKSTLEMVDTFSLC